MEPTLWLELFYSGGTSCLLNGLIRQSRVTPHFPAGFDFFRVEWERAAWDNAGRPAAEEQAKRTLLRWRLHALLAELTGDLVHYHEAAVARPDLPTTRAALGCALARGGRLAESLPHLEAAVAADPFDAAAARALYQAYSDAGRPEDARRVAQERWLLQRAAPRHVVPEPWHAPPAPPSGAELPPVEGDLLVRWEGPFLVQHSLGHVNRQAARQLANLDCRLTLTDIPSPGPPLEPGRLLDFVRRRLDRPLARPADVCVRHAWPLDPTPPRDGRWVVLQPWEYGAIPSAWLVPLRDLADEVWVPSSFVRAGMVAAGVPAERIQVIAQGADAEVFRPEGDRLPLPTRKTFKFLFVGGTIHRKGIDILLHAYGSSFRKSDDVCLVIKDMGAGSFYRGQTAGDLIAAFRAQPDSPEVVYLDGELREEEMAALYRACDCLVQPYRGEGFGLPIVEAMSCQLPVIVTGYGAALDYCDDSTAYLIPARVVPFPEKRVGDIETVDFPHLAEADGHELAALLRRVVREPQEAAAKALAARKRVLERLTWQHTALRMQQRLEALADQPVRRHTPRPGEHEVVVHGHALFTHDPKVDRHLSGHLASGCPYEPLETELLLRQARPGDTVLDLGANIGFHTLLLARAVGPTGRVYAFEPDPDNFSLLSRNVARHGYSNVVLVNKAASDTNGTARLYRSADNSGDHRLAPAESPRDAVSIATVRLDDYFAGQDVRIGLVKMDIQGAEALALAGMRGLLSRGGEVHLFCEFWPHGLARAGSSAAAFLDDLGRLGFELHQISEPHRATQAVRADDLLRAYPAGRDVFTNLACVRRAASLPLSPGGRGGRGVRGQRVSLCIIARNEEANLPACLESARDLFDEVIVLDTGSTDRTREIARQMGANVYDFPWIDHFAAARNACIEHATGDFIFWMDADDRLDEENREKLRQLFAALPPLNVAFSMKCRCLAAPGQEATVVDHIRLFRNDPRIRWRYRIHEQILGSIRASGGDVRFADVVITHTGYTDPALRGRKLQRDLRLLEMEYAEQPHDPFTLFNLGSTYSELGQPQRAEPLLQESLERSHPGDSIVRKLYVLLGQCRANRGQPEQALQTCLKGLSVCPGDAELLFLEALLRTRQNDPAGARAALVRLVNSEEQQQFASIVDGLRRFGGRHELAGLCLRLGEQADAEMIWRAILHERPDFRSAWQGLAELYLAQRRWGHFADVLGRLAALPGGDFEAVLLQARGHRAREEFAEGRRLLEEARQKWPASVAVLVQYSYLLLQEDRDHARADAVLAEILRRDPGNDEARRNREVLHQRAARKAG